MVKILSESLISAVFVIVRDCKQQACPLNYVHTMEKSDIFKDVQDIVLSEKARQINSVSGVLPDVHIKCEWTKYTHMYISTHTGYVQEQAQETGNWIETGEPGL